MLIAVTIPQMVLVRERAGVRGVARSPGIAFPLEEAILKAVARYGIPTRGVFSCDLGSHVGVVQTSERGFRVLAIDRGNYRLLPNFFGDPFAFADLFPPDWGATGTLEDILWTERHGPEPRTLDSTRDVLKAGDGPLILGAAQALLDGCRVWLADEPPGTVRAIWQLLPTRARAELCAAEFAHDNVLNFHLAAGPGAPPDALSAERCRDYPTGRYELGVQAAVEGNDARELRWLFERRTSTETLKLALGIVAFAFLAALVLRFV